MDSRGWLRRWRKHLARILYLASFALGLVSALGYLPMLVGMLTAGIAVGSGVLTDFVDSDKEKEDARQGAGLDARISALERKAREPPPESRV